MKKEQKIINNIVDKNITSITTNNRNLILLTKKIRNCLKIMIILFSLLFFCRNYYILYLKSEIVIDNKLPLIKQANIDFSNYEAIVKAIALYYPHIYFINESINVENKLLNDKSILKNIKRQINLAKKHGIFGFGFHYFWSPEIKAFNEPLDLIISNENLNINFFLIWENDYFFMEKNHKFTNYNIKDFFADLRKYILDKRYIQFKNKPIVGINRFDINEIDIKNLRQILRDNDLGEIFILSSANDKDINDLLNKNGYDGLFYSTSYNSLEQVIYYFNNTYNYLYTDLLYKTIEFEYNNYTNKNDKYIFRTSFPVPNCPITGNKNNIKIYGDYTPEKFYFLNKIIIDWTLKYHSNNSKFIFIKGFNNNILNKNYLEPDNITGYSNINSLSKALYNLPLISSEYFKYNLTYLQKGVYILVQAHIFYTDLLPEVINKTNNIPVPFDLYISTNTQEKKIFIDNYIKKNSKANNYKIFIFPNKGRDTIPFLLQLKNIINKYKYVCHVHTKKHGFSEDEGIKWQVYLYENLLGNNDIISKILTDFENNDKLGFFFPDNYHTQSNFIYNWNIKNAKYVNHILDILFPNKKIKVGRTLDFPVGNMFWAKTKAIFQLFNDKIIELCPKENGQIDGTALHGIERTWLYLVKINGFYYKTNLYYLY